MTGNLRLYFRQEAPHHLWKTQFWLSNASESGNCVSFGNNPDFGWNPGVMSVIYQIIRYASISPSPGQPYRIPVQPEDLFNTFCNTVDRPAELNVIFGKIDDIETGEKEVSVFTRRLISAPSVRKKRKAELSTAFLPVANIGVYFCQLTKDGESIGISNCVPVTPTKMDSLLTDIKSQFDGHQHNRQSRVDSTSVPKHLQEVAAPKETHQEKYAETFVRVVACKGLFQSLKGMYPTHRPCNFHAGMVPVAAFPANPSQWFDIDEPCWLTLDTADHDRRPDIFPRQFDQTLRPQFQAEHQSIKEAEEKDPDTHRRNSKTYDRVQLTVERDGLRIGCRVGRYSESVTTSNSLERELVSALSEAPERAVRLESLKHRSWLHTQLAYRDPVLDGDFRSSAMGITSVVIFNHDDRFNLFIHPRSEKVEDQHGLYHVAPSGMFQPDVFPWDPRREFNLKLGFFREFFEELYDDKQSRTAAIDAKRGMNEEWIYSMRPVSDIIHRLNSRGENRSVDLCFTGVGVNLLNLRADVCMLLLIRDPEWFKSERGKICWNREYKLGDEQWSLPGVGRIGRVAPLDEELNFLDPGAVQSHTIVPMAAAAIQMGITVARQLLRP